MHGSGRAGRFGPHPPASHLRALGREQMLEPSSEFESWLSVSSCVSLGKAFSFSVPPFPQG